MIRIHDLFGPAGPNVIVAEINPWGKPVSRIDDMTYGWPVRDQPIGVLSGTGRGSTAPIK
jgi:hypothetical protein